jgi:hypothetical protein
LATPFDIVADVWAAADRIDTDAVADDVKPTSQLILMRRVTTSISTSLIGAILTVAALPAAVSATTRTADLSLQAQVPLTVEIAGGPAKIGADGSAPVTIRARCEKGLNAFELDVAIRQEATSGSVSLLAPM